MWQFLLDFVYMVLLSLARQTVTGEQLSAQLLGQEPPHIKGGSINMAWLHDTFKSLPESANQADVEYAA
jgi:hypothetical protein